MPNWRFPSNAEWELRPSHTAWGSDFEIVACASEFFDPVFTHCDFTDAEAGFLTNVLNGLNWEMWFVHDF